MSRDERAGRNAGGATAPAVHLADPHGAAPPASPNITVFRCVSCARADTAGTVAVREIVLPCSGRLQPEHFLKAFETGADLVLILTCGDGDCRYLEGHGRVQRRVDYVRGLLDEVGLGRERLVVLESHARSDGGTDATQQSDMMHEALAAALVGLAPNPLGRSSDEGVG
jgi:F420-non-reducing hydrogenase iron-sulfur subunit